MNDHAIEAVARLNGELYDRIASFPPARTELVDFHYKDTVEDYVTAITSFSGRKLILCTSNGVEAAKAIRRAVLLSDVVVFTVTSHIGSPTLSLVPIQDDVASPVLGASAVVDSATREPRFATPQEYLQGMALMMASEPESSSVVKLLGRPFNSTDRPAWHRTAFSRTAQDFTNARREKCHIAGGSIHVQIPKDDALLEDAEHLMRKGRLLYAPFLSLPDSAADIAEGALKADVMNGSLAVFGGPVKTKMASEIILELQVPYLENIPLKTLSEILDDEGESIAAFRRELFRAIEDVDISKDNPDIEKRVTKLKRDVLEDELEKVRRVCERITRVNAVARIGGYVAFGSVAVAALYGLSVPSLITGAAGAAATTLTALWRNYEETRDIRRSPMHFVWRLQKGRAKE